MDIELFGKLIFSGEIEKVREIIESGIDLNLPNSNEMTPILLAIEGDQPKILELLLKSGANPNQRYNLGGSTPLHWAVDSAIDGMIQNNREKPYPEPLECIRILLDYGTDINIKDFSGKTVFDLQMTKEVADLLKAK